ncbi:ABC-type antimicrobial peptide transport system, ATPase component [hydrothermal vent metagenome]|uniref:ABC-type antimicrobial peptide transport system, ATPase component n=1 Tax=hydrothermal vent metagenome TaxID=652676 RepID=A0A1W1BNJ5_9ZZZZ
MITLKSIYKIFNENTPQEFKALKNINLEIKQGETIILSGVSGSGKSTLLSIIASLDRPSSGMVSVNGELVSKLPDYHSSLYRSKEIGFIFQHFNLLESLTVEDNILAPLIPLGIDILEAKEMVNSAMKKAHIEHKAFQSIRELSGGEKQRCAIARALVREPNIIICDEPTANLDKENSLKFIEILHQLSLENKTIIVATHDSLFENLNFESRLIYMEDGIIV